MVLLFLMSIAIAWAEPVQIGSRLELFIDDYLIDHMDGLELQLHKPTPQEVAIIFDEPWEGNASGYVTVFQDGDLYRMYYRCLHVNPEEPPRRHLTCYAESKDGKVWTKPELGLWEHDGSTANNIIWRFRPGGHNFAPFKDPNPNLEMKAKDGSAILGRKEHSSGILLGSPPKQGGGTLLGPRFDLRAITYPSPVRPNPEIIGRYKAIGGEIPGGVHALKSDDGIHWTYAHPDEIPLINGFDLDSQNVIFWDALRGEYRAYFRHRRDGLRDIMTATSEDFLDWSQSEPLWLEYTNAPRQNLYTNAITPYYRAPHVFLGFPMRIVQGRHVLGSRDGVSDALFMTSRDGVGFHLWGEAVLRPGLVEDRWISRSNTVAWGVVETESDVPGAPNEVSVYAVEPYGRCCTQLRRYVYRLDGFVSVQAPLSGGELVTKPLVFMGSQLVLNLSTSAAGSVRVEVQDANGKPIEGFGLDDAQEIYGDAIEYVVRWKGGSDVSHLAGRPVRLHFVVKDADLYSIRFR